MKFKLSKDKYIVKRINELRLYRTIFILTLVLIVLNIYKSNWINIIGYIILTLVITYFYNRFILSRNKESILKELNPELFLNINIWESKLILFKSKNRYNSALINIASAYTYDGKYEEAGEVFEYLKNRKLSKNLKAVYLLRKAEWLFYTKKYDEVKAIKDDILCETESLSNEYKLSIISNLDMYISMINKDKKKLKLITESLDKSDININRVHSIYIKSLFFEESDNKYQKMLAFEGGNLFIAREEFEDQNITTKNNIKPEKHKFLKFFMILVLIGQIIIVLI